MEWQPTFGCTSTQQVSLIQLAVSDQVFLLDLCANGFSQHLDTISFIRSLFSSRDVLKVGKKTDLVEEDRGVFCLPSTTLNTPLSTQVTPCPEMSSASRPRGNSF